MVVRVVVAVAVVNYLLYGLYENTYLSRRFKSSRAMPVLTPAVASTLSE